MAKITLNTITSSFSATSLFNTNFASIATELNDKVLYRNNPAGEANQMLNDLDMNSNDILNADVVNTAGLILNGVSVTTSGVSTIAASGVTYDDSASVHTATDIQEALDELGTASLVATGTGASDVPTITQADARYLVETNNLSDLVTPATARTNLGLDGHHARNLIINGDFQVWQRGTSFSTDVYTSDRWKFFRSSATATVTQQTHTLGQTDVPGNPKFFARVDITGADDNASLQTRIERAATAAGQEVTLSFYAKSAGTVPTELKVQHQQAFGTGGSPSSTVVVTSSAFTVTSSWQRFTLTVTLASISGKTLGSNGDDYLGIVFINTANETWEADISNVQLEFGDTATDFEFVPPATQLARCKRYFERLGSTSSNQDVFGAGYSDDTTTAECVISYTPKRSLPTITFSSSTDFMILRSGTNQTSTAISATLIGTSISRITTTVASGLTAGEGINLAKAAASAADFIDIDAEL